MNGLVGKAVGCAETGIAVNVKVVTAATKQLRTRTLLTQRSFVLAPPVVTAAVPTAASSIPAATIAAV